VVSAAVQAAALIGLLAAGPLVERFDPRWLVAGAGTLGLLVSLIALPIVIRAGKPVAEAGTAVAESGSPVAKAESRSPVAMTTARTADGSASASEAGSPVAQATAGGRSGRGVDCDVSHREVPRAVEAIEEGIASRS
jgi:hypothetical protein